MNGSIPMFWVSVTNFLVKKSPLIIILNHEEQDYSGKSNGKRGVTRGCPVPFFSLDETNPASPCYYISNVPNFRKNWQVDNLVI